MQDSTITHICNDADKGLEDFLSGIQTETSHHRMVQQENKCGFGLAGVCCRLCSNGPCRISKTSPKGVCGADADAIVTRSFLRAVAAGSGCYIHVVENAAKQLKKIAQSHEEMKGLNTLQAICDKLGIIGDNCYSLAGQLADQVLADLRRPIEEQMTLVEKIGYPLRVSKWKELGILPGGAKDEILNAVVKTSTNLNSDPVNMLLQCLRLGISTGLYGLIFSNIINDIILGEAQIGFDPVGIQIIQPDYINIMMTGHQPALFDDLQQRLVEPAVVAKANAAGAKGIRLVGCTCVGQDFQLRKAALTDAFCGHAGNNYSSEAILATGCIDMVLSEFNCTLDGIEPICQALNIAQICLDDVAKKKNAEYISYSYEDRTKISDQIIEGAIAAYSRRNGDCIPGIQADIEEIISRHMGTACAATANARRSNPFARYGAPPTAVTGVTETTLKAFLGGSYAPLIDLIAKGTIKGIAGVVGCSNLRAKGHDVFTVELTKELIRNDIIVLSAGCTSGGLANCGLMSPDAAEMAGDGLKAVCKSLGIPPVLNFGPCLAIGRMEIVAGEIAAALGVDLPQLPLVISAPQWLEEQALADGAFALALGLTLHLGLPPFVTGSPLVLDILTNQMKSITGGQLIVDTDVKHSAQTLAAVIAEKRKGLGI